jgi:AsmA protein
MSKLLKSLIMLAGAVVVLVIIGVFVLFAVIDPNRYRPAIEAAVSVQTGYELRIAGDISWSFRPVFGLNIADVRLGNGVTPQELASFSSIALRLRPAGLLSGRLDMQELVAENLHINWYVDADGQANWLVNTPATEPAGSAGEIPVAINIEQITISNASFALRDISQGIDTSFQNLNLSSRNANLSNRPFPLQVSMRLVDNTGAQQDLQFNLDTTAAIDFNAGNLALSGLRFNLSPLVLNGDLRVEDFHNNLRWNAALSSNRFNLAHLLENFTAIDEPSMPAANEPQFSIEQLQINGDSGGLTISALSLALDDARIGLTGDYLFPNDNRVAMLTYDLRSNALDLDTLLPAPPESAPGADDNSSDSDSAAAAVAAADSDVELPLELLNSINLRGTHNIESLTVGGLQLSPLTFALNLNNGLLNIDTQPIGFYDGELDATITLDARANPAQLSVATELGSISASSLTADMPRLGFFTGRFDMDTSHVMRGNTVNTLVDSISGVSRLQVSDSAVNITMLKRVFAAISVLSPSGDMTAQWPDVVQINNTEAYLLFDNGLRANQELSVQLDNFDISGTGGLDLDAGRFDYRVNFTILGEPALQTIRVNPDFQNVAWPVRCNAAFDDAALQYCSPDLQRVREVFAQIARDEIQRRATDAVSDQVDRLRDRIRNLLQD